MSERCIWGKIVRILDEQRILVNVGFEQGVEPGDRFHILELGDEIQDPESNEPLGQLQLVKAEVAAVHVQEKLTLMMPLSEQQIRPDSVLSATLASTASISKTPIEPNRGRLNVKPNQIHGREMISAIGTGDAVRSVYAKQ
ncbi:hypothetical protein K8I31_11585 [bacterium]|nr:hypothetical protein [bacterium]